MSRPITVGLALLIALCSGGESHAQPAQWEYIFSETMPPESDGFALAYDSLREVTLFVGVGETDGVETWTWDGDEWTRVLPPNSPDRAESYSMTFDARRGVAVLVGRDIASPSRGATWEWDGADWTRTATSVSPPARDFGAMAYDAERGVSVLWGGTAADADVWEYDGRDWLSKSAIGPAPRRSAGLAFDPSRRAVVLYGGHLRDGDVLTAFRDTWDWDGAAWTRLGSTPGPDLGDERSPLAYDDSRGSLIIGSRVAFEWSVADAAWRELRTSDLAFPSSNSGFVYDAARRRSVRIVPRVAVYELTSFHVNNVAPANGDIVGGTIVSIYGFGFLAAGTPVVRFGDREAAVIEVTRYRIRAISPPGSGQVDVAVKAPRGESSLWGGFSYRDLLLEVRYGNVGAGRGRRESVLSVNGDVGGILDREMVLPVGAPISIAMRAPASRAAARYALYLWRGVPTRESLSASGFDIGSTVFPTPLSGGRPAPRVVWNNLVAPRAAMGVPTFESSPAPSTVFGSERGAAREMTITLQGFIRDDGAERGVGLSVTNAVIVHFRR